eukprot:2104905-Rhodomonas_salina.4
MHPLNGIDGSNTSHVRCRGTASINGGFASNDRSAASKDRGRPAAARPMKRELAPLVAADSTSLCAVSTGHRLASRSCTCMRAGDSVAAITPSPRAKAVEEDLEGVRGQHQEEEGGGWVCKERIR